MQPAVPDADTAPVDLLDDRVQQRVACLQPIQLGACLQPTCQPGTWFRPDIPWLRRVITPMKVETEPVNLLDPVNRPVCHTHRHGVQPDPLLPRRSRLKAPGTTVTSVYASRSAVRSTVQTVWAMDYGVEASS